MTTQNQQFRPVNHLNTCTEVEDLIGPFEAQVRSLQMSLIRCADRNARNEIIDQINQVEMYIAQLYHRRIILMTSRV